MGLLNRIFGKRNTVRVQFIDASNGNTIGVSEMPPEQLPETFEIETTMHLKGEDWSVVEAIPAHSKDFIQSGELTLKMSKVEYMDPQDILFSLPTISNEIPQTTDSSLFNDFEYSILGDDWRQNEFLNKASFPHIELEIKKIEEVKQNDSKTVDAEFTAFGSCHVRDTIGEPNLNLDIEQLKNILKVDQVGSLRVSNEYVKNVFSLKTENTTFYGTIENSIVTQFCIGEFSDETSNEIQKVADELQLLFVAWCQCQFIGPND